MPGGEGNTHFRMSYAEGFATTSAKAYDKRWRTTTACRRRKKPSSETIKQVLVNRGIRSRQISSYDLQPNAIGAAIR